MFSFVEANFEFRCNYTQILLKVVQHPSAAVVWSLFASWAFNRMLVLHLWSTGWSQITSFSQRRLENYFILCKLKIQKSETNFQDIQLLQVLENTPGFPGRVGRRISDCAFCELDFLCRVLRLTCTWNTNAAPRVVLPQRCLLSKNARLCVFVSQESVWQGLLVSVATQMARRRPEVGEGRVHQSHLS